MWRGLCLAAVAGFAFQAHAQNISPVLTLNQDRLYVSSDFGKRVQRELEAASAELTAENRNIEAALVEEEQRLTDERAAMEPAEFRLLAEDFDERVTGIRQAQDRKANAIRNQADRERARFFELAFPVLLSMVEETGAVAILNNNAVIFSVRQIDITDAAIERVNAELGEAAPPAQTGPQPVQRPDPNADVPSPQDN